MIVVFATQDGKVGLQFGDDVYIIQPDEAVRVGNSLLKASRVVNDFTSNVGNPVKH